LQVEQNNEIFHGSLFLHQHGNETQIHFIYSVDNEAQTPVRGLLLFLAVTHKKLQQKPFFFIF